MKNRKSIRLSEKEYNIVMNYAEKNNMSVNEIIHKGMSYIMNEDFSDFVDDFSIPLHSILSFVEMSLAKRGKEDSFDKISKDTEKLMRRKFYY